MKCDCFHTAKSLQQCPTLCVPGIGKWFPGGSDGKASAYNAGDPGSIPGLGRSPGEGNGNPLQYSCQENPMNGGACQVTVHGVAKNRTQLSNFTSLPPRKSNCFHTYKNVFLKLIIITCIIYLSLFYFKSNTFVNCQFFFKCSNIPNTSLFPFVPLKTFHSPPSFFPVQTGCSLSLMNSYFHRISFLCPPILNSLFSSYCVFFFTDFLLCFMQAKPSEAFYERTHKT